MSKETQSAEIQVKTLDIGILLTTQEQKTTEQLFHSVDQAIGSKDLESHLKTGIGAALVGIGVTVFFGSIIFVWKGIIESDQAVVSATTGSFVSGWAISYIGYQILDSGRLARKQWNKLKEFLNQASQSATEHSEQTTPETN